MKPRFGAPIAVRLAVLASVCGASPAWAAERTCPFVSIESDSAFRARFSDLLDRLQRELASRSDIDACARIVFHLEGDSVITMSVQLPDGRTTSRSVTRPDDIAPTLQALLLVPLPLPAAQAEIPAPPSGPPHRASPRAQPTFDDRKTPAPENRARRLGIELSFITGARAGGGQVGVGAGALSFLELYGWLLGFEGRADSYRAMLGSGDRETALELAVLAGRRFHFDGWALDLTAGPGVAVKGFAVSDTEVVSANMNTVPLALARRRNPNSGAVPRLLFGARFGFSPRSVFRTFVGIDGELGPAQVADEGDENSARLPAFSLGLALGATVGTP